MSHSQRCRCSGPTYAVLLINFNESLLTSFPCRSCVLTSRRITWFVRVCSIDCGCMLTSGERPQDIEGLDALMSALKVWNGGVIVISHDTRFIET